MKKKSFALIIPLLCLSCSLDGIVSATSEGSSLSQSATQTIVSESLGSRASTSAESSSQFDLPNPFNRSYDRLDGMYQCVLYGIQARLSLGLDDYVTLGSTLSLYCEGDYKNKVFSPSDFPEADIVSIDQSEVPFGVMLTATLSEESTQKDRWAAPFLLMDNPNLTYASPASLDFGFFPPWAKKDGLLPPNDQSSLLEPCEEQSYFEKAGIDVTNPSNFDYSQLDLSSNVPGYLYVKMKMSENREGVSFGIENFPDVPCACVIETTSNGRRVCIIRLSDHSLKAMGEAAYKIANMPNVFNVQSYGSAALGYQ